MTERTLGAKAGHLELLKDGKKNKDNKDAKPKGGSKKFGGRVCSGQEYRLGTEVVSIQGMIE